MAKKKKDLIPIKEGAKITGLSRSTLVRKIHDEVIVGEQDGRAWLVSKKSIHQAMADGNLPDPRKKWGKKRNGKPCEADEKLVKAYRAAMTAHFMETHEMTQEDAEAQADSIGRLAQSLVPVL